MAMKTFSRPRQTVKLAPECGEGCTWCSGTIGGEPAMHVVFHCQATNMVDNPIFLLKAFLDKPFVEGDIVVKNFKSNIYGTYPIFPENTTQVAVHFFIQPPKCETGKDFKTTITIVDMYGNKHKTDLIRFIQLKPEAKGEEADEGDSVAAIRDPIDQMVAKVLKAELYRYKNCGRLEGGLGSVITKYKKKVILGVGSDLRALCPYEQYSLIKDPHNAAIESDNAESLIGYYNSLQNREDREKFRTALLTHLNKNCEYGTVGYFIVLVLLRIGELAIALETAKSDLRGDRGSAFMNVLMLLDGLLKYSHHVLTENQIEEIEIFISDLDENAFRIRERLGALRRLRLFCDNCSVLRQSLACISLSAWGGCQAWRRSPVVKIMTPLYH